MFKFLPLLFICLSLFAQSLQQVSTINLDNGSYAGSYPASFTAFGNDVYALANVGEERILVYMPNGSAAHTSEVRYENQIIPAYALERCGDALFVRLDVGMYVIEAPGAAPRYVPTPAPAIWIGESTDGQLMMVDQEHRLHRYVRGIGMELVGSLEDGEARLSFPIAFRNAFYYLAYEVGGPIELRTITTSGERAQAAILGTATDINLSFGNTLATVVGGELYFAFTHEYNMSQLWRTDGTAAGTHLVFENNYEGYAPAFISLVSWNQGIAFSTATESNLFLYADRQLETIPIDSSNFPVGRLTPLGQNLLFIAQGGIYRKGLSGAPQLLYSTHLPTRDHRPMPVSNGQAYLLTEEGLWHSDGTSAGSDLNPLTGYRTEGEPFPRPGELWCAGNRQGFYPELLVVPTSGEPRIQELNPAISPWPDHRIYALGSRLLYLDQTTQTLHVVTGTTDRVLDSQVYRILPQTADHLYYLKFAGASSQLWRTDGTQAGTTLLLTTSGEDQPSVQYIYPSGDQLYYTAERNNIVTIHRLRADGISEQLTGYDTHYLTYFADGLGGLYLTGQVVNDRLLWYVAAGETEAQLVTTLSEGYETETPAFTMVHNRLWMMVGHFAPSPVNRTVTLISSDGTPEGTITYVRGARAATLPVEVEGRAGMVVAIDGLEGLVFSDGSSPLQLTDLVVALAADTALFKGYGFDQVFGTEEDGENQLWRYDLESGEAVYLATLPSGLRPYQRLEVGETTLLVLAGQGRLELWQTDGSAEGTERIGAYEGDANPGVLIGASFYFSARGPAGDRYQRLYVWSAEHGAELVATAASLSQPEHLALVGDELYFLADHQYTFGLYRLSDSVALPPIQLSAKKLGMRGEIWRINAETIAGASYAWQLQNATVLRPANGASLLIRASRLLTTKISVLVTLPNGDQRSGTLELTPPPPVKSKQSESAKKRLQD